MVNFAPHDEGLFVGISFHTCFICQMDQLAQIGAVEWISTDPDAGVELGS